MRASYAIGFAAICAAAVLGVLLTGNSNDAPYNPQSVQVKPPGTLPHPASAPATVAIPSSSPDRRNAVEAIVGTYTKIEQLRTSTDPQDSFMAYRLIRECLDSKHKAAGKASAAAVSDPCKEISPGQVSARLQMLDKAAAAGIHGAAAWVADEGPTGYGVSEITSSQDAAYVEWTRRLTTAIEAGARNGDEWSLERMSARYENGEYSDGKPDYRKALSYWVAANVIHRAEKGGDMKSYQQIVDRYAASMTAGEASSAIAEGITIAGKTATR